MKKKLLGMMAVATVAIAIVVSYNAYISPTDSKLSGLALSNIEALAQNDEGDKEKGYTRVPADCEIVVTGKANSTITVAGIGTVKLDSNGEYRYTKKNGEVRCILGGGELCIPQNC